MRIKYHKRIPYLFFSINNRTMKRLFIFLLSLVIMLTLPAKEKYVKETEHFQLIFDSETEESARDVLDVVEDYYKRLVEYFNYDPKMRLPVYFTTEYKNYNAYLSSFPSFHIVMYVTHNPFNFLTTTTDVLKTTFFHELTHAFTQSIKSGPVKFISSIFGESFVPGSIYMYKSFVEGIAVLMESKDGEGRLNDPNALELLNNISEEKINLSYMDIAGSRDTYPGGELSYILGASFLEYLENKFGRGKLTQFIKECYLFPISTTQLIFSSIYGCKLSDIWNEFLSSLESESKDYIDSVSISEYGGWSNLILSDNKIYLSDTSSSALYSIENGEIKKEFLSSSSFSELSESDSYLLFSSVNEKEEFVEVRRKDGRLLKRFDNYYSGLLIDDSTILLVSHFDRRPSLTLFSLEENRELYTIELDRGWSIGEFTLLNDEITAFLVSEDGITYITLFNYKKRELSRIVMPKEYEILSLARSYDLSLAFSYYDRSQKRGESRYGEIKREKGEWIYKVSDTLLKGGVSYPVKTSDDRIYFISSFFNGDKVSFIEYSSLDFSENQRVKEEAITLIEEEKRNVEDKSRYIPILNIKRGTLFPLASNGSFTGLGGYYIASDPTESNTISFSLGYSLLNKLYLAYFSYSYKDYLELSFSPVWNNDGFLYDANLITKYKKNLHSDYRYIKLQNSFTLSGDNSSISLYDRISFYYQDTYKRGIGRYERLGYSIGFDLTTTPYVALDLALTLPRLLPIKGTPKLTISLPSTISLSLGYNSAFSLSLNTTTHLLTYECQKAITIFSLYLRQIDLKLLSSLHYSFIYKSLSQMYSLSLDFNLSPVIGYLTTINGKLDFRLNYVPERGLSFNVGFAIGL